MNVPIWAFHGDADPVVPVDETTRLVEAMKGRGAQNLKLTIYPGVNHDSWTQTYDDPAVWEWLFAQKRGTAKPAIPPPPPAAAPPPPPTR